VIRRLILWWRILLDRETRDTTHAAWLANLRRELYETQRELAAHVASWAPIYASGGQPSDHPAHTRTQRLQARVHDLKALISEHA
jgi:hypothetical protein